MKRALTLAMAAGVFLFMVSGAAGQLRKPPTKGPPSKQAAPKPPSPFSPSKHTASYWYHVYNHAIRPHSWPPRQPYQAYYRYPAVVPYYVPQNVPYRSGYTMVPNFYEPVYPSYPAFTPSTVSLPPASRDEAVICVILPHINGKVWFNEVATTTSGVATHVYNTPPLTPGFTFEYRIKAQWNDRGYVVTRERNVQVRSGGTFIVDFTI